MAGVVGRARRTEPVVHLCQKLMKYRMNREWQMESKRLMVRLAKKVKVTFM